MEMAPAGASKSRVGRGRERAARRQSDSRGSGQSGILSLLRLGALKKRQSAPIGRERRLMCPPVRPVQDSDVAGILVLVATVFAEYGCVLRVKSDEPHLLNPGPYFRAGGGEFWVGPPAGPVLATVALKCRQRGLAELKSLYVHPGCRGRGWGRGLVELAMAHARRAGKRRMELWSDTRFVAAHALYHRMGFLQRGLRRLRDSNDSWEYGFSRTL